MNTLRKFNINNILDRKHTTKTIGIIGDGQLAQMTIEASHNPCFKDYDIRFNVLCLKGVENSICNFENVSLYEIHHSQDVDEFTEKSDIITYEFEDIDIDMVRRISKSKQVFPSYETLDIIQDKIRQKHFLTSKNIPCPNFSEIEGFTDYLQSITQTEPDKFGNIWKDKPHVIKLAKGGYNGKGVMVIDPNNNPIHTDQIDDFLGLHKRAIIEDLIDINDEYGVIVVRNERKQIACYTPVRMHFTKDNVLDYHYWDKTMDKTLIRRLQTVAINAVDSFNDIGVFGVELFETKSGDILVNEISPRTHNSGHHTIEACHTSQFEQVIRIALNIGIGDATTNLDLDNFYMFNILGPKFTGNYKITKYPTQYKHEKEKFHLHSYRKHKNTPNRKIGHLTVLNLQPSIPNLMTTKIDEIIQNIKKMVISLDINESYEEIDVGIIMGSESDYPVMEPVMQILKEFNISHEVRVVSAHRTPELMYEYATTAHKRGLKVIIAGAGGAAHLPGMTASLTPLPVIGVPVKSTNMSGLDSLYSIVQMPRGVPVATMAINGSLNAGLMAVKILSVKHPKLLEKMEKYMVKIKQQSIESNAKVHRVCNPEDAF